MILHILKKDQWNALAENAHLTCFKEERPAHLNTFDFAVMVEENDVPLAYATCIELDSESVYMQHGGAFPSAAKSAKAYLAYKSILNFLRGTHKRASTRIRNTNLPMLKMALKEGFIINGIDYYEDNQVYLHLLNGFK